MSTTLFHPWDNPMGVSGLEFLEFSTPEPLALSELFETLGFKAIASNRHKDITLYRQGQINFLVNGEPDSFAQRQARLLGATSICGIALRVNNADYAYRRALDLGAWGFDRHSGPHELGVLALKGASDMLLYLVDRWRGKDGHEGIGDICVYDYEFEPIDTSTADEDFNHYGVGMTVVDHYVHGASGTHESHWTGYYQRFFNFVDLPYADIESHSAGASKHALVSPCGRIRIPIQRPAESSDELPWPADTSSVDGRVQRLTLGTRNICETAERLHARGISFHNQAPAAYYEQLCKRAPHISEHIALLQQYGIVVDGAPGGGLLLRARIDAQVGPIRLDLVQRGSALDDLESTPFTELFTMLEHDPLCLSLPTLPP